MIENVATVFLPLFCPMLGINKKCFLYNLNAIIWGLQKRSSQIFLGSRLLLLFYIRKRNNVCLVTFVCKSQGFFSFSSWEIFWVETKSWKMFRTLRAVSAYETKKKVKNCRSVKATIYYFKSWWDCYQRQKKWKRHHNQNVTLENGV